MKSILISIKPRFVAKILNGEKTIEVRKGTALYKATQKLIDEYGFADFYVYCTKDEKQGLVWDDDGKGLVNSKLFPYSKGSPEHNRLINGKVIFKFRCYKVEEIRPNKDLSIMDTRSKELIRWANLSLFEGCEYLKWNIGYAIHISDLEIFDKPKELSEFYQYKFIKDTNITHKERHFRPYLKITKAPQSFCYIEVGE